MIIGGNGQANWDRSTLAKGSKLAQQSPLKDGFRASETDWTPVKPSIAVETHEESSPLKSLGSALMLTLGVALTLGASGCASLATAHAADVGKPQIVQTHPAQVKHETAKPNLSYQVGQELHKAGKDVQKTARPVIEKGAEVGKEIGKTGAKVGKEIGKAGKEFGLGVAKEATSFWKGLTGH